MFMLRKSVMPIFVLAGAGMIFSQCAKPSPQQVDKAMTMSLPKGYVCYRADHPLNIDGKLDDPSWQNAPWTDDFEDIEGDKRPKPRFRTRAKMLWDDDYFYVAAELEEPHIWGTLTQRDCVIFQDNDFEVFIDPDSDNHQYYEFEMNALNTVWDLRLVKPYRDGGPALNEWDIPGLKTGVNVEGTLNDPGDTDSKWTVEIAFPWSVLAEYANRPSPPQDSDRWRVNFSRVEWQIEIIDGKYQKVAGTKEDNWVWSPQGVVDMHRPEHWGYVQFSTAKPGQAEFVPEPTESARQSLMKIYYAQQDYAKKNQVWASSIDELQLDMSGVSNLESAPQIEVTPNGFIARINVTLPDGNAKTLRIDHESRILEE